MAYYYVKSGGTAAAATDNGRYASQQTGTFAAIGAAGYYNKIEDASAATTIPADGDFVLCSDLHDYTSGAAVVSLGLTNSVYLISVDDANCENYKAGAKERTSTGTTAFISTGEVTAWGMALESVAAISLATSGSDIVFNECSFILLNAGKRLSAASQSNTTVTLRDCTITYGATDCFLELAYAPMFRMYGGSVISTAGGDGFVDYLFTEGFLDSGGHAYFEGVDLSIIDGNLLANTGNYPQIDDVIDVHIHNCKLHASVGFTNEPFRNSYMNLTVTNSASTAAGSEYQYHHKTRGLIVDDIDTIYRNNSTAFPSGQKISLKVVTDQYTWQTEPASFEFPTLFAELSSTGTDLLRIFIVSSTALTDIEVWAEASYPDGTNTHWGNHVTSGNAISGSFALDPFATGTTLTTNTEVWTSPPATPNYYQIDLDTSADVGADGIPVIRVYVAKASATIYFCPDVELF